MDIENIIQKHGYNEELSNFIRSVYPLLVKYYNNEEIVYESLMSTPIKLTNNVYDCLIDNGFLRDTPTNNEMVSLETLKFCSGAYHCEPVIKYDKARDKYELENTNRIIAINASSLELDTVKATLIHEICHLIKSYNGEHTIREDTLIEKSGFISKTFQLNEVNGVVKRTVCFETGVGLEEGFNAVAEEQITSELIGKPFTTKGYQLMRSLANNVLSYNIPNLHEVLKEAEIYHDNTRVDAILGETYYKLLAFGDKLYPMLVDLLNPSNNLVKMKEISSNINSVIDAEYEPIRKELETIGNKSIGY
ncbi:MAG: hypothetical protein IKE10_01665 [Bacilli bacterium]|nr:hypothetical protein [Bacilli bacterium]